MGSIDDGDFFVKFNLRDRKSDFKWVLVAVYGAAQPEFKESFLAELVQTCDNEKLPLCIGGDFNIIRNSSEKNNDRFEGRWPFLFNAVIDSLDLREIEMFGRKFTWANSCRVPTYERLDRVLVSTEWEQNYPLVTVEALNREISDHTPLLLSTGEKAKPKRQPPFKFELGWLLREGFFR
jgi:endonuclease/exonuclease/phosphatase family metal-dependent hydrolase